MSQLLSGHPWCCIPQRIFAIASHIWACSFSASLWFLGCCCLHLIMCQRFVSVSIDVVGLLCHILGMGGCGHDGVERAWGV
jgi:hypothetical protein